MEKTAASIRELYDYKRNGRFKRDYETFHPDRYDALAYELDDQRERTITSYAKHHQFELFLMLSALGTVINDVKTDFISSGKTQHRVNAFRYAKNAAMWFEDQFDLSFKEGVPFYVLVGIVQAIYTVCENDVKYISDYYKNRPGSRSLLAAIKNDSRPEINAFLSIERRIRNQILLIFCSKETTRAVFGMEGSLLQLKNAVFSQTSFTGLQAEHQRLYRSAKDMIDAVVKQHDDNGESLFPPFLP